MAREPAARSHPSGPRQEAPVPVSATAAAAAAAAAALTVI